MKPLKLRLVRTVLWTVAGFCDSHSFIFSNLELICKERKQRRRRKGRRWRRSRGGATKQLLLYPSPLLCNDLIPSLLHFCCTLLCMWFLTFSFFALYFFLKFPKLSTWLLTLALEILKTFNFWIKDELNPLLLFSFGLCINKKKKKKLWPLSRMWCDIMYMYR